MITEEHAHIEDHGPDWYAIVTSLLLAIMAFLVALAHHHGWRRWSWTMPSCRFCGEPIQCQDPDCETDTHSHDGCARSYQLGLARDPDDETGPVDELEQQLDDVDDQDDDAERGRVRDG